MVTGRSAVALLLVLAASVLAGGAGPAAAEGAALSAGIVAVDNRFPDTIVFKAEATSSQSDITTLNLLVSVGRARGEAVVRFPLEPGRRVAAELSYPSKGLPAGAYVHYAVEVEDAAGNHVVTDRSSLWYADTRYQWSELRDGPIIAHYYGDGLPIARRVLAGARDAQGNTGKILGTDLQPFDIVLYNTTKDAIGAQTPSQNIDGVRSLAFGDYALVHVVNEPRNGTPEDAARHESTHMFVNWTLAPGTKAPSWANEGFAVWSERSNPRFWQQALAAIVRRGQVPRLRTLGAFPRDIDANTFAYVQGWSVVSYLIDTHGAQKFGELFHHWDEGEDGALQRLYGLTLDELDTAWRAHVGLPEQSYERVRPTPLPVPNPFADDRAGVTPPAPVAQAVPLWPLAAAGAVVLAGGGTLVVRRVTLRRSSTHREVSP